MKNQKIILMSCAIVAAAGIFAWIIIGGNLIPSYTTETVKVVAVDDSGCTVETSDGFDIKIGTCSGKPGEMINATFDSKIRDRSYATHMNGG